jgi:hypothetical protein
MSASAAGTAVERGAVGVADVVAGVVMGAGWVELPSKIFDPEEMAALGSAREARKDLGSSGTWI